MTSRDHSGRFPRVSDPLGDTLDEQPARELADDLAGCVAAEVVLTDELRLLVEAMASVVARTVAALEARVHTQRDHVPRRLAELETFAADMRAWRLSLTGVADTNGRMGQADQRMDRIEERIPATLEQRLAEVATIRSVRWSAAKLLVAVGTAATIAGGGIWQTIKARGAIERGAGRDEQHTTDQDRRLDSLEARLDALAKPRLHTDDRSHE